MRRLLIAAVCAAVFAAGFAGCTGPGLTPAPTPGITSTASGAIGGTASTGPGETIDATPAGSGGPTQAASVPPLEGADLRYRLVDEVGRPLFCDPDFYPVARDDETVVASQKLGAIRADVPTYTAIATRLGIDPGTDPTPAQAIAIYRDWKMLRALVLTDAGGHFGFDYIAASKPGGESGFHVVGNIDAAGTIAVDRRDPSGPPPCPICLARGTLIATPNGDMQVEDLRPGFAVWTTDRSGRRVASRVQAVGSTPVPATHRVVDLALSDGRSVLVSPGHRLADGRLVGDVRPGDSLDGATVVSARLLPYDGGATFDLLPFGPTGTYWANGIPLASTLVAGSR